MTIRGFTLSGTAKRRYCRLITERSYYTKKNNACQERGIFSPNTRTVFTSRSRIYGYILLSVRNKIYFYAHLFLSSECDNSKQYSRVCATFYNFQQPATAILFFRGNRKMASCGIYGFIFLHLEFQSSIYVYFLHSAFYENYRGAKRRLTWFLFSPRQPLWIYLYYFLFITLYVSLFLTSHKDSARASHPALRASANVRL